LNSAGMMTATRKRRAAAFVDSDQDEQFDHVSDSNASPRSLRPEGHSPYKGRGSGAEAVAKKAAPTKPAARKPSARKKAKQTKKTGPTKHTGPGASDAANSNMILMAAARNIVGKALAS
jgi:hypothetical protein